LGEETRFMVHIASWESGVEAFGAACEKAGSAAAITRRKAAPRIEGAARRG
jgi:hypothetical protein